MRGAIELLGLTPQLNVPTLYLLLALGAALENVIPPVPADTFVVLGGVLASQGVLQSEWVFVVTWAANVASATTIYGLGRRYGSRFFAGRLGRRLLSPSQLAQAQRFFSRWGVPALVFTRFLPGVRAVVPAFAGVSRLRASIVLPAFAVASAVWYAALVALGSAAGENLPGLLGQLRRVNRGLLVVAVLIMLGAAWWWRRTRSPSPPGPGDD